MFAHPNMVKDNFEVYFAVKITWTLHMRLIQTTCSIQNKTFTARQFLRCREMILTETMAVGYRE